MVMKAEKIDIRARIGNAMFAAAHSIAEADSEHTPKEKMLAICHSGVAVAVAGYMSLLGFGPECEPTHIVAEAIVDIEDIVAMEKARLNI